MGLVKRTYVDGETVITADNLNDIQDEIIQNASDISEKGTYSKPTGGIPSTDMTTAVQTSLGKADTAYQKPSGGIPSTDLASSVQTSLGKADSALQSSDIDNTLTVSGKAADAKKTGDEISGIKNTLNKLESEIGIVIDGKYCELGASSGQYVILKNSTISGKTDGLYRVVSGQSIPAGETNVTASMLTPIIQSGGLNELITPSTLTMYFDSCFSQDIGMTPCYIPKIPNINVSVSSIEFKTPTQQWLSAQTCRFDQYSYNYCHMVTPDYRDIFPSTISYDRINIKITFSYTY